MKTKEDIIQLKLLGVKNCQIAELLSVSKQYVSRVCKELENGNLTNKCLTRDGFATVGFASHLLGIRKSTVRRWSDEGRIPSFYKDDKRRVRIFKLVDLWKLKAKIQEKSYSSRVGTNC